MTSTQLAQNQIHPDLNEYSYTYTASAGNKVSRSVMCVLIALGIAVPLIFVAVM